VRQFDPSTDGLETYVGELVLGQTVMFDVMVLALNRVFGKLNDSYRETRSLQYVLHLVNPAQPEEERVLLRAGPARLRCAFMLVCRTGSPKKFGNSNRMISYSGQEYTMYMPNTGSN